jgi:DNA-binding MarR family transcriptional regulator
MSGPRRLLKARVDELEGLFREKRHDAWTLRSLAAELIHRDSSRANRLLKKVKARLDEAERDTCLRQMEVSQHPTYPEPFVGDHVPGELPPYAAAGSVGCKAHASLFDAASFEKTRVVSTKDVFGEQLSISGEEERDGPDPFSANGSVKRKHFSENTVENPSRLTASEGAQWLNDIGELFGTSELNLHTVAIFLRIAHADRLGQPLESHELARITSKSTSTVSRNVGLLGDWRRQNQHGMGLITAQPDNVDRRRKPIRLTSKGKQLLRMIEDL